MKTIFIIFILSFTLYAGGDFGVKSIIKDRKIKLDLKDIDSLLTIDQKIITTDELRLTKITGVKIFDSKLIIDLEQNDLIDLQTVSGGVLKLHKIEE